MSLLIGAAASVDLNKTDVVIMGDSITWLGKDDCTGEKGWSTWWKKAINPASCRSYARSGATWSNTPATKANTVENIGHVGDDNTIYNQIVRMEEAIANGEQPVPGLIMIAAGTNDLWFPQYRPEAMAVSADSAWMVDEQTAIDAGPTAATSMTQAVRLALARLNRSCPDARVIILTPLQATSISAADMARGSEMLEKAARLGGALVIRQDNEMPVDSASEREKPVLTYDGIHTSAAGAKANGQAIAKRVSELLAR